MKMSCFNAAKEEAAHSDYSGSANVGCVIYYKGALIARGHNSNKTSPVQAKFNTYRYKNCGNRYLPAKNHAEITALKKIRWLDIDFSKIEVYTYRELKNGKIAMSRPCPSCMAFIKQLGVRKIFYTTEDGFAEERLTY